MYEPPLSALFVLIAPFIAIPIRRFPQFCALSLTSELLSECEPSGSLFIRKVAQVDSVSAPLLKDSYE